MTTERVTDDIERLLRLLPQDVQDALQSQDQSSSLLEVVLDLGRIPEARYPGRALVLGDRPLNRDDLESTVSRLGSFGADNRAGIERTLHRISAIRNRQGDVVGLTCRIGRAVFGTVAAGRLRAHYPLGMGWWLARPNGAARLCRGHGCAHYRRRGRAGRRGPGSALPGASP